MHQEAAECRAQVAQIIAALKPHRDRDETLAVCIGYLKADRYRMSRESTGNADCLADPTLWKASASKSKGDGINVACRFTKAGANSLLAFRCCLQNMRWPDFIGWEVSHAAAT